MTSLPENYRRSKHPRWESINDSPVLVDPAMMSNIGAWDPVEGQVMIFGHGFLKKNPEDPSDYKFVREPKEDPWPKEGGFTMSKSSVLLFTMQFDVRKMLPDAPELVRSVISSGNVEGHGLTAKDSTLKVLQWYLVLYYT